MKRWTNRHSATAVAAVFLVASMVMGGGWATAQQRQAEAKAAVKKERAKPRGRLPSYFSRVVTEKQREEIYGIQGAYEEQLAKLREEIAQLELKRDKEVDKVLSDEQLAQVKDLRDKAKAKRAARARKKAAEAGDP